MPFSPAFWSRYRGAGGPVSADPLEYKASIYAVQSVGQTINTGVATTIVWSTQVYDDGWGWPIGFTFTVPAGVTVAVVKSNLMVDFGSSANATGRIIKTPLATGTPGIVTDRPIDNQFQLFSPLYYPVPVLPGDTLDVEMFISTGPNRTLNDVESYINIVGYGPP